MSHSLKALKRFIRGSTVGVGDYMVPLRLDSGSISGLLTLPPPP